MTTPAELRRRWMAEPGRTIRQQILAFVMPLEVGHGKASEELFRLLPGLPYRSEVASGRDFRGGGCGKGIEQDFRESDFSFSPNIACFIKCDLAYSRFDECGTEPQSFGGSILRKASFLKARFRGTFFSDVDAQNACFDDASLHNCRFDNANLQGASFRNANLKGVCFAGANIIGCDFRGANLDEAVLNSSIVDKTTDFRGANLVNAYLNKRYNSYGQLVDPGLDLDSVTIDATTRLGDDLKAQAVELLNAALEVSNDRRDMESMRVRHAIQRVLTDIQKEYFDDWYDRVISYLAPSERAVHDEIMSEAHRSLL